MRPPAAQSPVPSGLDGEKPPSRRRGPARGYALWAAAPILAALPALAGALGLAIAAPWAVPRAPRLARPPHAAVAGALPSGTASQTPGPRGHDFAFLGGGTGFSYSLPYAPGPPQIWVYDATQAFIYRVTIGRKIADFAVSSTKMVLALADSAGRVRVYSLKPPYERLPWHGPMGYSLQTWGLRATCGTVAAWTEKGTVDGVTGASVGPPGAFVACSTRRGVMLKIRRADLGKKSSGPMLPLYLNGKDAATAGLDFAVSSGGRYFAYLRDGVFGNTDRWPICVYTSAGPAAWGDCTPRDDLGWNASGGARLGSVTDDGWVIFSAQSDMNGCPTCSSIYAWRPSSGSAGSFLPVLLEPSGADPQWISPAAARALIARYKYLRAHRKQPVRRKPPGG